MSWSQASGGATVLHQRIYIDGGGIRRTVDTATNLRSFSLTDLQSEVIYMVSVQSLSSQLPSPVSDPVTTYIGISACTTVLCVFPYLYIDYSILLRVFNCYNLYTNPLVCIIMQTIQFGLLCHFHN